MALLPLSFYARPVHVVARELLGQRIVRASVELTITEVEAYGGSQDSASHARFGITARNEAMWGPPGRAYVYLCYGMHQMFNVVTDERERASAVLIRACEVVEGHAIVLVRRRATRTSAALLAGPGKVGQALELDPTWSGHPLNRGGGLMIHEGEPVRGVVRGPRVGIDFATPRDRARRWRFAIAGHSALSAPRNLV